MENIKDEEYKRRWKMLEASIMSMKQLGGVSVSFEGLDRIIHQIKTGEVL